MASARVSLRALFPRDEPAVRGVDGDDILAALLTAYTVSPGGTWFALVDRLFELRRDAAAARVRWWHSTASPALTADGLWRTPKLVRSWYEEIGPFVNRVGCRYEWAGRLVAAQYLREVRTKCPTPGMTVDVVDAAIDAAVRHAFSLATDGELEVARSAALTYAWERERALSRAVVYLTARSEVWAGDLSVVHLVGDTWGWEMVGEQWSEVQAMTYAFWARANRLLPPRKPLQAEG